MTADKVSMVDNNKLIQQSWERCRQHGLTPCTVFHSPIPDTEEIISRRRIRKELIEIAEPIMRTILTAASDANFLISLVDSDGYILSIYGDGKLKANLRKHNFFVGARWRESEIGTSAIVVTLLSRIPIQIIGDQHYCAFLHNYACTAAPIIIKENELLGSLCISSHKEIFYPNTLGMTIAISETIAKQVELRRALNNLQFSNRCQEAIINSINSGFMIVDNNGNIVHMNELGGKIFGLDVAKVIGKHVTEIVESHPVVLDLLKTGEGWTERELFIDSRRGQLKLIETAIPVKNESNQVVCVIKTFREMDRVHAFATKVMGARARFTFDDINGHSTAIKEAVDLAALAAESDSTLFIYGETGTGKEVFAQAIHNASSRGRGPYLAINCAAIPRDLMESELFGYVQGAFSGASKNGRAGKFELAAGGTLLLDEIGDLPLDMQAKLLRVLQDKVVMRLGGDKVIPVDVRIIAATNKDLQKEVKKGNFREDLFYRINIITIKLPPLRRRKEDIPLLAHYLMKKIASRLNKYYIETITSEALRAIMEYHWPGNVRELENALERAINTTRSTYIDICNLPQEILDNTSNYQGESILINQTTDYSLESPTIEGMEYQALHKALETSKWNITHAARQLGISRTTIYDKMKKYGLSKSS